jgi:FkbM family methyltransferase
LWSSYAAARIGDGSKVIAVEPGEETRAALKHNQKRHGFVVDRSAIYNEPGIELTFNVHRNHASSSLGSGYSEEAPVGSIKVITTTLVSIVQEHGKDNQNIIIKLDVEGVEREAMLGATNILKQRPNAMIIYEDHGADPTSETTRFMLKEMKMHVYMVTAGTILSAVQIMDVGELNNTKIRTSIGYNLVACIPGTDFDKGMQDLCVQEQTPEQIA